VRHINVDVIAMQLVGQPRYHDQEHVLVEQPRYHDQEHVLVEQVLAK
jgi:hypothetical protein